MDKPTEEPKGRASHMVQSKLISNTNNRNRSQELNIEQGKGVGGQRRRD